MVTGYEVLGNDITKVGKVFPVALVIFGKFIQAKKYTYNQDYNEDGTYPYPPIPYNILWLTGDSYWRGLELTGSKEGTE